METLVSHWSRFIRRGDVIAHQLLFLPAAVCGSFLPHLESMQPNSILACINDIEKLDRLTRRNYGLSDKGDGSGTLNLNILSARGGRTLIAIDQQPNETPEQDEV